MPLATNPPEKDEAGRVAHGTYQEAWYRKFHRAMTVR
jgi:hypothetical protein